MNTIEISPSYSVTTHPNIVHFIEAIKQYTTINDVKWCLSDTPSVIDGNIHCSGYFIDHPTPKLAVACRKPVIDWVKVLVHEACHMDQYLSNAAVWKAIYVTPTIDTTGLIDLWIDNKIELSQEQLSHYIKVIQDVEMDCEKRAVDVIKRFKIPFIDIDEYIQQANAYVWFYLYVKNHRKWYTVGKEPYNNEKIWRAMPTTFIDDYGHFPTEVEWVYTREMSR